LRREQDIFVLFSNGKRSERLKLFRNFRSKFGTLIALRVIHGHEVTYEISDTCFVSTKKFGIRR